MSGAGPARWDWYRLADVYAAALVESSAVGRRDLVLDLGAGEGAITRHLARTGAQVIAFELHPRRAADLRSRFGASPAVTVVRADVTDLRLPRRPFHVVANPPFGSVSQVLARLTSRHSRLDAASLILPVDVAARWEHRLVRDRQPWRMSITARLPRSAFTPRPRIDCCVVRIERRR